MEIIYRQLSELKKLENNPRNISDEQLEKLRVSIERNPDYFEARPIILSDRTGELVIIAGNQRYEACALLGIKEVPTVLLSNLTEEREREIIIRDNVNNGEWDKEILSQWDANELFDWGVENITFSVSDFFDEESSDDENRLKSDSYEAGASILSLKFPGYNIPLTEDESMALKRRADEYVRENGVVIGFVRNLLGL